MEEDGVEELVAGLCGAVVGACLGAVGVGAVYELAIRPRDRRQHEAAIRGYEGALRRAYVACNDEAVSACLH